MFLRFRNGGGLIMANSRKTKAKGTFSHVGKTRKIKGAFVSDSIQRSM